MLVFGWSSTADSHGDQERIDFKERIVLSPFSAKRLAMQLQNVLRAHDQAYGPAQMETPAMDSQPVGEPGITDPRGRRLLDLVGNLGVVFGLERSFKASDHTLLHNRFLVTMTRESGSGKGRDPRPWLDACSQIRMPEDFMALYGENLSFARFVHFGFEENDNDAIYKAYLEFQENRDEGVFKKPSGAESFLLYLGFKWDASASGKKALTRYVCHPRISFENILDRISRIYQGAGRKESVDITREVVEMALGRINEEEIIFLEAYEDHNPRISFDINVYRANLLLEELYPLMVRMCRHFSIPRDGFHDVYDPVRYKRLGHISGGIDREGKDFLTVYYGVEGYAPSGCLSTSARAR